MSAHDLIYGGWTVKPELFCDGKIPQKIATGVQQVFGKTEGARYTPLMYCGYQQVNGMNHMIICEVELITNPPAKHVTKIVLHETDDPVIGEFSLLSIDQIV